MAAAADPTVAAPAATDPAVAGQTEANPTVAVGRLVVVCGCASPSCLLVILVGGGAKDRAACSRPPPRLCWQRRRWVRTGMAPVVPGQPEVWAANRMLLATSSLAGVALLEVAKPSAARQRWLQLGGKERKILGERRWKNLKWWSPGKEIGGEETVEKKGYFRMRIT